MKGRGVWYVPAESYIEGEGFRVSLVFEDESGHYPTGTWPYHGKPGEKQPWFVHAETHADALVIVKEINKKNGFDEHEVALIVARSMQRDGGPRKT